MKQHWARILPAILSCLLGLILALTAGFLAPASMGPLANAAWWIWLVLVGHLIWRIVEWQDETFVITNRRLILVHGLFVKKVAMMPLSKVTDMSYNRSPLARILGFGTFLLESAGQDQALSTIDFVRQPDARYRQICTLIFDGETGEQHSAAEYDEPEDLPVDAPYEPAPHREPQPRGTNRQNFYNQADDWEHDVYEPRHAQRPSQPYDAYDEVPYADTEAPRETFEFSRDFDGWEGSPRVRRGGRQRQLDDTDPYGIAVPWVTNGSRSDNSPHPDPHSEPAHTYADEDAFEDKPVDAEAADLPWSVSREHCARPQTVRRQTSRDPNPPFTSRDD